MAAVQNLYDVAISTPQWVEASQAAHSFMGGTGRRLTPHPTGWMAMNLTSINIKVQGLQSIFGGRNNELTLAVTRLRNAAEAQLRQCMRDAQVDEASLGLPVSIEMMTGSGTFLNTQTMREKSCYTMSQWLASRLSYYSGFSYAEKRAHDGSNVGLIVAIVVLSLNLFCIAGCFATLVVCIRRRTCYFCMKEVAPVCVTCLVECGCGPEDADRLNNEVVLNSADLKHSSDVELQQTHT